MRELADAERIRRFMRALGAAATADARCYFTGGATAVLHGWRDATVDVDILLLPESESLLRAVPALKDELELNVELASPLDFVPVPAGWEERSLSIGHEGSLTFLHFDPYAQALAKLERGHQLDLEDVHAFVEHGLVEPNRALGYFAAIEPELFRFPAVDPRSFRRRVEEAFG